MRFLLLAIGITFSFLSWGQGTTSSEMRGIVTDVYSTPGSDFNNFTLYQFVGFEASDGLTPKFSYRLGTATGKDIFTIGGTASRWRMR